MDEIERADDYLEHVDSALAEARRVLEDLSNIALPDDDQRAILAKGLGHAHNAVGRAATDLRSHRERYQRSADANLSGAILETILTPDGMQPQLVAAVLPLPIEGNRIDSARFADREFANDFTRLVTRFNNEFRRGGGTYLMEVPGGMSWHDTSESFAFTARADGATEDSHIGRLYPSGAFVYTRLLYWAMKNPKRVALALLADHLNATLVFVEDLYQMLQVRPRAIAVQFALFNAQLFNVTSKPPLLNKGKPLGALGEALRGSVALGSMPLGSDQRGQIERTTLAAVANLAK